MNPHEQNMNPINVICPICGEHDIVNLTDDQLERFVRYQNGEGLIQEMLPDLSASEREQLKTGICSHCWDDMFG